MVVASVMLSLMPMLLPHQASVSKSPNSPPVLVSPLLPLEAQALVQAQAQALELQRPLLQLQPPCPPSSYQLVLALKPIPLTLVLPALLPVPLEQAPVVRLALQALQAQLAQLDPTARSRPVMQHPATVLAALSSQPAARATPTAPAPAAIS